MVNSNDINGIGPITPYHSRLPSVTIAGLICTIYLSQKNSVPHFLVLPNLKLEIA